jgi:uncharacterized protein
MKMQIAFADISKAGNRYEISDDSWSPEQELQRIAPVDAEVSLTRKGDSRVFVRGFLKTEVKLVCDRCVSKYGFLIDVDFHLVLEVSSKESWQIREIECSGTDLDTVLLEKPMVDLGDILRQQLYLSLPEKLICSEQCKGLCPQCGANLNKKVCSCVAEEKESPFALLAKLK